MHPASNTYILKHGKIICVKKRNRNKRLPPEYIAADNGICAEVAENPANYLVPHPGDCTKFYSCQSLGVGRGWKANLMDCPPTTGFDTQLRHGFAKRWSIGCVKY